MNNFTLRTPDRRTLVKSGLALAGSVAVGIPRIGRLLSRSKSEYYSRSPVVLKHLENRAIKVRASRSTRPTRAAACSVGRLKVFAPTTRPIPRRRWKKPSSSFSATKWTP